MAFGRPLDWSAVNRTADPVPGNPDDAFAAADTCARSGRTFGDAAAEISKVVTALDRIWSGLAAVVFAEQAEIVRKQLKDASLKHWSARAAFTLWGETLEFSQRVADVHLTHAIQAQADLAVAHTLHSTALGAQTAALDHLRRTQYRSDEYIRSTTANKSSPDTPIDLREAKTRAARAEEAVAVTARAVADAQERLTAAIRGVDTTAEDYQTTAQRVSRTLDDAAQTPQVEPSAQTMEALVNGWAIIAGYTKTPTHDALLGILRLLTPTQLTQLLKEDPTLTQQFWDDPPPPDAVARWWQELGKPDRAALVAAVPGILGNLPGIPYTTRDTCNRKTLANLWAKRNSLTPEQRKTLTDLKATLDTAKKNGIPAQVVSLFLGAGVPMAAVGYGNLDTAETTTWCAPGMGFDASQGMKDWSTAATNLYLQQRWLDSSRDHAVVAWLGYDTPSSSMDLSILEVTRADLARAGAHRLTAELDGNHATRAASEAGIPVVSVVAHSYGTTTAADALTTTRYRVDSFTMVGSAGIDAGTVSTLTDLKVKSVNGTPAIYTTSANADQLAPYGAHLADRPNPNPAQTDPRARVITGATAFTSEPTTGLTGVQGHDPLGAGTSAHGFLDATPSKGHGYFDQGTSSLRNMAATSLGMTDSVRGGLTPTDQIPRKGWNQ